MICNVAKVRRLFTKFQVDACKTKKKYTYAHLVIEIQAMIYDAARVRRSCTKFQVDTSKNKNFHFGGGGLDCGQYQILTDPRNGVKNLNMNLGNDWSHSLGGV